MSDKHFNTMESYEMLKALYDFQAVYPKTISFDEGEYFILHQTSARQRNWWQVVSMKGNIGFVPSNYVMKLKVEPEFLVGFLDSSIESLKLSKETEINGIISRDELIQKLEEKKDLMQAVLCPPVHLPTEDLPKTPVAKESKDKVANGSIKNTETRVLENCVPTRDENHTSYSNHKPEFTKKSMSSPAVGTQLPQLVTESPSMSVIATKLEQEPPAAIKSPIIPVVTTPTTSSHQATHYDNSIASEPSDNTTTTTTSDEITTVSKCDITEKFNENDDKNDSIIETKSPDTSIKEVIDLKMEKNDSLSSHSAIGGAGGDDGSTGPLDHDPSSKTFKIDDQDVYQIIDSVRQSTNLSHELSCVALRIVLSELETILPNEVLPYFESIASHLTGPLSAPNNMLGQTHDAQRLRIIFADLAECKNDTEQRSWMLYEDEDDISRFLKDLTAILTLADPKICCHEMIYDQYQSTTNLVLYYQMETRWTIRKMILDALTAMCHLDFTAVNIMLNSILPIELVEDMKVSITKVMRLKELAAVLTIIFSIGQKMPITHEENLGTDFVLFLLTIIETPPDEDTMGILPDVMINLLLSFNLQFDDFANNIVLEALKKITDAKNFTEKILLLVNREEDPIQILSHTSPPVNSVLKMFVDLFSTKETAALFYMNDNKVLIDILVRQLSDLSPGDKLRKWYLELCRRILRNTDYTEHTHRKQDLMKIFTRIFCEETECSAKDQQLVREIANEFPQIFKA